MFMADPDYFEDGNNDGDGEKCTDQCGNAAVVGFKIGSITAKVNAINVTHNLKDIRPVIKRHYAIVKSSRDVAESSTRSHYCSHISIVSMWSIGPWMLYDDISSSCLAAACIAGSSFTDSKASVQSETYDLRTSSTFTFSLTIQTYT